LVLLAHRRPQNSFFKLKMYKNRVDCRRIRPVYDEILGPRQSLELERLKTFAPTKSADS